MASSYRRQATIAIMVVTETKRADSPKASGPYMRVIIGEAKMPRAWPKAVPPASLRTSERNDDLTLIDGIISFPRTDLSSYLLCMITRSSIHAM